MNRIVLVILTLIAAALIVGDASAQIVFGDPASAEARFVYQSWTIDNGITGETRDLTQWYFPVFGFVPLPNQWEIHVSSASAGTQSDSSGVDASITGLNDTRIAALHSMMENRLLLGLGVNLPTGKTTLAPDQSGLSQLITADFLNLPSKMYGEGFGLYAEAAFSEQLDQIILGVGAGFLLNASYSPVEGIESYDPGNRFTAAGTAVYTHELGLVHFSLRHTMFGTSAQDDVDVYKIGAITEFVLGTNVDYEQFEIDAGVRQLLRQADSRLVSGELKQYEKNNYGNDLRFYSSLGYNLLGIGKPLLLIDYKRVNANGFEPGDDEYEGKASLFGVGAGFEKSASDRVSVSAALRSYSGSADDSVLDLTGFELSASVRATF